MSTCIVSKTSLMNVLDTEMFYQRPCTLTQTFTNSNNEPLFTIIRTYEGCEMSNLATSGEMILGKDASAELMDVIEDLAHTNMYVTNVETRLTTHKLTYISNTPRTQK